jgi:hypothetical protein
MSGFGQFSQEAYDQLREAYADSLTQAEDVEKEGIKIGGETLGLETAPFKADWLDKTGVWQYPSGKGDYQDARQSPEDLMAALRDENGEIENSSSDADIENEEEDVDLESMTDEEFDAYINELLVEMEDDDSIDPSNLDEEEDDDIDLSDLNDEELLELAQNLVEDEEASEEEEEDLISVSDKIAALKEELAALSANVTLEEDEEESTEETDSEEDPIEEQEEVDSDDEPA